jgi:hypothetical protein
MEASGDLKTALQGLIQIAAGLHKRSRGQTAGARYLITRGLEKVRRCQAALPQEVVAAFVAAVNAAGPERDDP